MKAPSNLILFQLILSAIAAYLLSQMSFFGRVGISLFYKEYSILKDPLLSGAIIFTIQLIVIGLLQILHIKSSKTTRNIVSIFIFVAATIGMYLTYLDFTEEFSSKILRSKFHFGGYLFWIGIITSSIYYLFRPKKGLKY
ncbi:hypothetical protein GO491_10495 [Flavobacteriaceae bacterium Ap0902]|nr:hypothetical protein [Flavobacteriaceae bacterium Ap0902]